MKVKNHLGTVVIEFPSYDEANSFYQSKEYQDAHSILKGYVEVNIK